MSPRTFDRVVRFDERSLTFPSSALVGSAPLVSRRWLSHHDALNQGQEGECVGHGWAGAVCADPQHEHIGRAVLDNPTAEALYEQAQRNDGSPPDEQSGASVLGGAKAAQQADLIASYTWALSLDDTLAALSAHGPVVLGVNWYTGMFDTDSAGFIAPTGKVEGGHCVVARGISVANEYVLVRNSWGKAWGSLGDCKLHWADLDRLLHEQGEAAVPVKAVV